MTEKSKENLEEGKDPDTEQFSVPFHFEDKEDEVMGIETATYPNGNQVKRLKLSNGKTAFVRELIGSDSVKIDKAILANGGDREEQYYAALFHHAVKVDGQQLPMEDFAVMKMKDYTKIKLAVNALNF
jgi:hypothetical protein